jgi:molecular chaperone GrpE
MKDPREAERRAPENEAGALDPERDPIDSDPESAAMDRSAEDAASADEERAPDYRDRWLRAEAELQNYRRRSQRDVEEARRFSEERVLLEMISLLDDLERAVQSAREAGIPDSWVQGVQLVANRMNDVLGRYGVTAMDPIGDPFDPQFHEALLEVDPPPDTPAGHVVQVVRKGYRRDRRALRPARVVVARREAEAEA